MFFNDLHAFESIKGNYINISKLTLKEVDIEEIAYVLSGEWRFGGHSRPRISVAQHCLNVVAMLAYWEHPVEVQLQGLLHDASEAYLRDIPTPIKRRDDFESYRKLEEGLLSIIFRAFGLSFPISSSIKVVDEIMAWIEGSFVMLSKTKTWHGYELVGKGYIDLHQHWFKDKILYPVSMRVVELDFVNKFDELRNIIDEKKSDIEEGGGSKG